MSKKGAKMGVKVLPLRSLEDFILSAKFKIPNFNDLDKWEKRLVYNLIYYQTNYFLLGIFIFTIVGIIHPVELFCGIVATCAAFSICYYFANSSASTRQFKKNYPICGLIVVLIFAHFAVYFVGCVIVFLWGILLPIVVTFVHASIRRPNIQNRLVNKMEEINLKRTPMGLFLESIGREQGLLS